MVDWGIRSNYNFPTAELAEVRDLERAAVGESPDAVAFGVDFVASVLGPFAGFRLRAWSGCFVDWAED